MKIVVVGPNIMQSGTTGFHIHAVGCRDLRKPKYGIAEKEQMEAESVEAIARDMYADHIAERPGEDIGAFVADFTVFPCVKDLG